MSAWLQVITVLAVLAVLAAVHVPLGNHLARAFVSTRHLRAETALYRAMPMVLVLALAGSLAGQRRALAQGGT